MSPILHIIIEMIIISLSLFQRAWLRNGAIFWKIETSSSHTALFFIVLRHTDTAGQEMETGKAETLWLASNCCITQWLWQRNGKWINHSAVANSCWCSSAHLIHVLTLYRSWAMIVCVWDVDRCRPVFVCTPQRMHFVDVRVFMCVQPHWFLLHWCLPSPAQWL